jgi:hypothetical protein
MKRLILTLCFCVTAPATMAQQDVSVERGRYLVVTTGCNDCHTANYASSGGKTPESEWLKGDALGWRGPWGTTYPTNLRRRLHEMTEDEWVAFAKTFKTRPPMPWFNVNAMHEADLRSIYLYVTSFDDLGAPAPAFVPPDREPEGAVIQFPAPPP